MESDLIRLQDGRVRQLILSRPEKRNALNLALCRELTDELDEANQDPETGAILLTGQGTSFCAGMDLEEAGQANATEQAEVLDRLFSFPLRAKKPLVVAAQGPVIGGGVGLVACAHFAIAAQGATFALTGIRIAAWPFVLFHQVAAAIGERRALELSLTGRALGAPEAVQAGLVQQIAPAFEFDDRAATFAHHLATNSPAVTTAVFRFLEASRGLDREAVRRLSREFHRECIEGPDFAEGLKAMRESRSPVWGSPATGAKPGGVE